MIQFPSLVQAALLFDQPAPLDLDALVQQFLAAGAEQGITYNRVFDTNPGIYYRLFGTNDVMITLEMVPGQANAQLFETALSSGFISMATPDARQRIARHQSHALVGVHHGVLPPIPELAKLMGKLDMPMAGSTQAEYRQRLTICSQLAQVTHGMGKASLVHWTVCDNLLTGEAFSAFASEGVPGPLHVHPLLYGGGKSVDGKDQIEIKTFGASSFIGREIHLAANPLPLPDALAILFAFLKIATVDQGYVIPDGDTFGPEDHSHSYRVRHVPEGGMSGNFAGPLFQIELLHSRPHGFTSPEYFGRQRTFDDRNFPPDVTKELGSNGKSIAMEWRAGRQMAEGIGGSFEVRAAPKPKRSLLGWLPFGLGKTKH